MARRALGAVLALVTVATTPARAELDAAGAVAHASALYEADRRGILAVVDDFEQSIDAVVVHQRVRVRRWFVTVDGAVEAAGISEQVVDGKPLARPAIEANSRAFRSAMMSGDGEMRTPLPAKYSGQYTYADAPCDHCAAGERAVAFAGAIRDGRHGHGIVVLDARGKYLRYVLEPYVYPDPRMTGGNLTGRLADVLDGRRLVASIEGEYRGHQGPLTGKFHFKTTYTTRRFDSLDAAIAAVHAPD